MVRLTDPIDTTAWLPPHKIKCLQQIIGTFLFYGRAVDPTLLTALSELSSAQATATAATKRACHQFLDYCASHPTSTIHYHASDMVLKLHSDSSSSQKEPCLTPTLMDEGQARDPNTTFNEYKIEFWKFA